jgi:phosphatidate cytidylyltransferase
VLKQRLITAVLLGILVILSTLLLPSAWFGSALLAFIVLGAWEWSGLLFKPAGQVIYCAVVIGCIGVAWRLLQQHAVIWLTVLLTSLYWCYVPVWLWRYAVNPGCNSALTWALAGFITLLPLWVVLMDLHSTSAFGPPYVLFLFVLVAVADSSAYFVGRRWGRHKLAPRLSPGKTFEGAIGAIAATLLVALPGAALLGVRQRLLFLLVCLVTAGFSIIGDLLESMLKRQHAAKDSGFLLPGHGGLLDRLDSLTAAAPVFLLGLSGLLP